MRHHNAAQRPRQITGSENAEGLHLFQPAGHIRRKEQRPHRGGKKHKHHKVVKLQRTA